MRKLFSVLFALALALSVALIPAAVSANPYDRILDLDNKDASWARISDTTIGTLQYNSSGPTFDFSFTATGLEASTEYSLIYYADTEDRFNQWGGDNPGTVIGTETASGGNLAIAGSVDLNMDLPSPPDANAYYYDYTQSPDFYDNATGAKIWLVPSNCYDADANKVTTWVPARFLFETDLIWYDDTDVVSVWTEVLPDLIQISVSPSSLNFGQVYRGHCSEPQNLDITNIGSVTIDLSAETSSAFYQAALLIDSASVSSWSVTGLGEDATWSAELKVCVPSDWPAGVQAGTVVFWAEKSD